MKSDACSSDSHANSEAAMALLREIVEDGLRHGFFECSISCEIVNGKKRRLVIRAGKSYQFTILETELPQL
jgi:hypothetical protein